MAFVFLAEPSAVNAHDPLPTSPFLVATIGERTFRTGPAWYGDLALSPDGALLAGGTGPTVVLLDAKTGAPARWIGVTPALNVTGLAFTADGARLVAAGWDDHFVLLDVATGAQTARIPLGRAHAMTLAASPADPDLVFSGGFEEHAKLWSLRDARVVWEVPCWSGEHALDAKHYLHASSFSSDGRLLITVAYGGADLWDVAQQQHLQRLGDEDFSVAGAAFSRADRSIILTSTTGHVARYDTSVGHRLADALCPSGNRSLHRPVVTPDGALLLVCGEDGKVHLLRAENLAHVASIATQGHARAVVIARDSATAFACENTGRVLVLSLPDGAVRAGQSEALLGACDALAWSPDHRTVLALSNKRDVTRCSLDGSATLLHRAERACAVSSDGACVVVAEPTAVIYDTHAWSRREARAGALGDVVAMAGEVIVSASRAAVIFDPPGDTLSVPSITHHPNAVWTSPDGARAFVLHHERNLAVFDVTRRALVRERKVPRSTGGLALDGRRLVLMRFAGGVTFLDADGDDDGTTRRAFGVAWATALAASPDGALVAAGLSSGGVALIETARHELRAIFDAAPGRVDALVFSHDGARLATSGGEALVRVWDVAGALDVARPLSSAKRKKKSVGARPR